MAKGAKGEAGRLHLLLDTRLSVEKDPETMCN
jgi:hypothetical protein